MTTGGSEDRFLEYHLLTLGPPHRWGPLDGLPSMGPLPGSFSGYIRATGLVGNSSKREVE